MSPRTVTLPGTGEPRQSPPTRATSQDEDPKTPGLCSFSVCTSETMSVPKKIKQKEALCLPELQLHLLNIKFPTDKAFQQLLVTGDAKRGAPFPANRRGARVVQAGMPRAALSQLGVAAVAAGQLQIPKAGPWCHRRAISRAGLSLSWSPNSLHSQTIWTPAHAPTQADGTCLGVWKFIFALPFSISKLASP